MKLAKLHSRFCTKRSLDFGTHIEANNVDLGIHLFETLDWALTDWWCDANMKAVFFYLRGAKGLYLGEQRHLFPKTV